MQNNALAIIVLVILDIWAILSILMANKTTTIKTIWIILVVIMPALGFIIWLLAGPKVAKTEL